MTDIVREALESAIRMAEHEGNPVEEVQYREALAALSEREKSEDELVRLCHDDWENTCFQNPSAIIRQTIRALSDAGVLVTKK